MASDSHAGNGHAHRRWAGFVLVLIVIGVALRVGALDVPFGEDDYAHISMISGTYPVERPWWDLYRLWAGSAEYEAHRAAGTLPWWADPTMAAGVFRPLSSGLLTLDHQLFPNDAVAHHLHSLAWWVAMMIAAAAAFRRWLPASLAPLALVVFALDDGTVTHVGWLANRCAIVSATFGLIALRSYVDWRESAAPRAGILAGVATTLSLAAGEYGLALVCYGIAYELFGRGHVDARPDWSARARQTSPLWAPALAYLLLHLALGYGYTGSAAYASPFDDLGAYLGAVLDHVPLLVANATFGMSAGFDEMLARPSFGLLGLDALEGSGWMFWLDADPTADQIRSAHRLSAWIGVSVIGALVVFARPWWSADERRALTWLGTGGLLSTLVVAVAPAHPRLLLFTEIGLASVVAALVLAGARALRGHDPTSRVRGRVARAIIAAAAIPLVYSHFIVDPIWTVDELSQLAEHHGGIAAGIDEERVPELADLAERDVILVVAEEQSVAFRMAGVSASRGRSAPRSWQTLSLAQLPHTVQRTDPHTIVLAPVHGALVARDIERFFRIDPSAPQPGQFAESGGMRVTAIVPEFRSVQIRFERPLEDYLWLTSDHGLRHFDVPEVGAMTVAPLPFGR